MRSLGLGTDSEEHLDEVLAACAEAGVSWASAIVLHVRPGIRDHFMPWLKQAYPFLYPRYVELYGGRAYAPYAAGYFGAFGPMDVMFMGLMFGAFGGFEGLGDGIGAMGEGVGDMFGGIGDGIGDMFDGGFDF